jgi:ribosomal protein S18 acetylase RimI-like enzyme
MFASVALATRIEHAEARLTRALAIEVVDPSPLVRDLGGGVSAVTSAGSPLNKIIGVGFQGDLDDRALDEVESDWRQRREPARVELATLAEPTIGAKLTARGYRLQGFENVLGLALAERAPAPKTAITVEPVREGDDAEWLETVIDGFSHPDGSGVTNEVISREALAPIIENFRRASGMIRSLARWDGAAAGAASLRIDSGIAQLCGATTLPQFRRRGVQRALLNARLLLAAAAGCDVAVITTSPGTQSQANAQKQGFALLYARAILVRDW